MRQACKRMSGGFAVLLALWVVSCSGGPTSPTDFRAQVPTLSSLSSALDAGGEARGCTFGAGYWKRHPHAWPGRFDPNATFLYQREVLDRCAHNATEGRCGTTFWDTNS